ncbi:MAG: ABC transporter permease [Alicyclobacillus sp.]|nr:ABC transporter permease [Alicyclobacillus sp.]
MRALRTFWRILRSDTAGQVGFWILVFYTLMATVGRFIVHPSKGINMHQVYAPISLQHLLGTDMLGRDNLGQLVAGSTNVLVTAVIASAIATFVGVVIGMISGYVGGWVDTVIMRITDVFLTVPSTVLAIVLVSFIHPGQGSSAGLIAILSITDWAGLAQPIRAQALSLSHRDFVEAARIQGLPFHNILFRQLLPNMGSYVAMHFLLGISGAIYALIGLALIGAAPFSGANWGVMLNQAMSQGDLYTLQSLPTLLTPMLAIVFLQLAFILFTRTIDKIFNPRLRVEQ